MVDKGARHDRYTDREHHVPADESVEEIAEEKEEQNPDPTTRREAFETELMEEDRSAEGGDVGDHIP